MIHAKSIRTGLLAASTMAIASCSGGTVSDHQLAHADSLLEQRRYSEAASEYDRAFASAGDDARVNARLGLAAFRLGQFSRAWHHLLKAQERAESNSEARAALATLYLLESMPEQARDLAYYGTASDSTSVLGAILLAATSLSRDEATRAVKGVETLRPRFGSDVRATLALGTLYSRAGDSSSARREFEQAVASAPGSLEAHSILAEFYGLQGNAAGAERERRVLAEMSYGLADSARRSIETLILLGRRSAAETAVRTWLTKDSSNVPARRILAELALSNGNPGGAIDAVTPMLARDSTDVDARVLRGRALLAQNQTDSGIADLRRAASLRPNLAPVHLHLGLAELRHARTATVKRAADSSIRAAANELSQAVRLIGNYPAAVFQLADLNTQAGNARAAIKYADRFARANPQSVRAHVLLGAALLTAGRFTEATEAFRQILELDPANAQGHYWVGIGLLREGKLDPGTDELEEALKSAPGFAEAATQLVLLDLASRRGDPALARVQKQLELAPQSAPLYDLLGVVHAARNEPDAAETAFVKALQLDPRLVDARIRLSELYSGVGKLDQATAQADSALKAEPANIRALMALGNGAQAKGDVAAARSAYERALAIDSQLSTAANNLAFLLSEQVGDPVAALKFATQAHELAPNDPRVMDTLGWILYKRGDAARALELLKTSGRMRPDSPTIQYHLGMAAKQAGDTALARDALSRAASSPANFVGKDEARKALDQMK